MGDNTPYHSNRVYLIRGCIWYPDLPGEARVILTIAHQHAVVLQQHKQKVVCKTVHDISHQLHTQHGEEDSVICILCYSSAS